MRMPHLSGRILSVAVVGLALSVTGSASGAPDTSQTPTPGIACGTGSLPESMQGRAPLADVATGRYAKGYTCNTQEISHFGATGGYRVERYVDAAGHECAYYDSTTLFPLVIAQQGTDTSGT